MVVILKRKNESSHSYCQKPDVEIIYRNLKLQCLQYSLSRLIECCMLNHVLIVACSPVCQVQRAHIPNK